MTNQPKPATLLLVAVWLCQILLSACFLWAAFMKLLQPAAELAQMWPWTADNPTLTKLTGIIDLLGGIGLVLPSALRIKPQLTIYAAYGAILLMLAAIGFHASRGEISQTGFNVFFGLLAAFVAWARTKKLPTRTS